MYQNFVIVDFILAFLNTLFQLLKKVETHPCNTACSEVSENLISKNLTIYWIKTTRIINTIIRNLKTIVYWIIKNSL